MGGIDLRHAIFALIAIFVILSVMTAGCEEANNITYKKEKSMSLNYDQKVSGTGFFSSYKYSLMLDALTPPPFNGTETKSKAHGSGKVDFDLKMHVESYHTYENYTNPQYIEEREEFDNEEFENADSIIELKEDSKMSYSSVSMAVGSRYYNLRPVIFNSLLNENVWIKNRDNFNSMTYATEGAHMLPHRALDIYANYATTTMNVSIENLTSGKVHFGVLGLTGAPQDMEGSAGLAMKAWKRPLTEVDEDYVGTFDHIRKNMTIIVILPFDDTKDEEWLPCCSLHGSYGGGWDYMYEVDRRSFGASTNGVFDCTCFKVPNKAQFAE